MATEIKVPSLGELVTEATVAKWLKRPGEAVAVDEPVVELETDKVTLEVPAPAAGTLAEIVAEEGANLPVGAVLGRISEGSRRCAPSPALTLPPRQRRVPPSPALRERVSSAARRVRARPRALERSGPAVRKLIAESGLDAAAIAPTGPGNRITKADVIEALARPAQRRRSRLAPPAPAPPSPRRRRARGPGAHDAAAAARSPSG